MSSFSVKSVEYLVKFVKENILSLKSIRRPGIVIEDGNVPVIVKCIILSKKF